MNEKLKENMIRLLGQIDAIQFPIMWTSENESINQAYYDLIDSIQRQYIDILKELNIISKDNN